jgi:copper(I)-binding protein
VPLWPVAFAAALLGGIAPTLSGHASTAAPQLLMRGAVFLHMASLLFWLGALAPLAVALARNDTGLLRRFSRIIPWIIAALLLSGITLALVQLGPPEPDWLSPYGVLLAAKLVLVAALLLLALWNRVRLTARAASGTTTAPLRRSIAVELVLVVAILGIVAGWRFTPPPRVLAEIAAANAPVSTTLRAGAASATLTAIPGRAGHVALELALSVDAEAVTLELANPGQNIATIRRSAKLLKDRRWRADNVLLPVGGDWSATVQARTGKFDPTTLRGTLGLPATGMEMQMPPTKLAAAALASSMLLAPPASAAGLLASCPLGQSFSTGAITVSGAYARATPPAAQSAGAYLSIRNDGDTDDTLLSASTAAASDTMLHSSTMNGQVMEMAPMPDGLPVPAHGEAALDPMHAHLMLTGMSAPFAQGQCLEMTLHFAKAGDLPIQVVVGSFGQSGPVIGDPAAAPASSMQMDMSGMSMDSMSSMPGM